MSTEATDHIDEVSGSGRGSTDNRKAIREHAGITSADKSVEYRPDISVKFYQHDWIPGFAAFYENGALRKGAPAHAVVNIGSLVAAVNAGDLPHKDLPYILAESIMHEVIHAFESWADVEFSEAKVGRLISKYRRKYGRMSERDPKPSQLDRK